MVENQKYKDLSAKVVSCLDRSRMSRLYILLKRPLAIYVMAFILVGTLTGLAFLNRAGSVPERNWPVNWNISNSDNGVLYQFSEDVYEGRSLDWTFSPQVYVFPEIPVSLISYGASKGNPHLYFMFVAILNNILLFSVLLGLSKLLYKKKELGVKNIVARSLLAFTPLFALPLLADNTVFFYHLAPTYYFGAYLFCLAFPLILLSSMSRNKKLMLSLGYVLTAASNPLLLIFTVPAALVLVFFKYLRDGARSSLRSMLLPIAALAFMGLLFRQVFFSKIAAINPSSYISVESFKGRLGSLDLLKDSILSSPMDKILVVILLAALTICAYVALRYSRMYVSEDKEDLTYLVRVYLGLSPFVIALVLYCLLIINPLYLWPLVGIPMVVAPLIYFKDSQVRVLLVIAYSILLLFCISPKSMDRYANVDRYFDFKPELTRCLDSSLPAGSQVGYSTFSDARKTGITSDRDILLVQVLFNGGPSGWLTNTKYSDEFAGSFFVINDKGDEKPIDESTLLLLFGDPDSSFRCGEDIKVIVYSEASKLELIDRYYDDAYRQLNAV